MSRRPTPRCPMPRASTTFCSAGRIKSPAHMAREAEARLLELIPDGAVACQDNRQFLGRAVRYLTAERGIRQFIDIGTARG